MSTPHDDAPRPAGDEWAQPSGAPGAEPATGTGGPGGAAAPRPAQPEPPVQRPQPRYGQYAPEGSAPPSPPAGWGQAPGGWGTSDPAQPLGYGGPGAPVPPPGQYGQPGQPGQYGQYGVNQYGQAAGPGAPGGPAGPAGPGWQPPALQPGIVPLRPLGVWEIFDGAFRAVRANPRVMFGLSAIVVTVVVAIDAVVTWYLRGFLVSFFSDTLDSSGLTGLDAQSGGLAADSVAQSLGSLATLPLTSLASTVLTGLLIVSVSRSVLGQKATLRDVTKGAAKRIWWIIGFSLLTTLAVLVVAGAYVGLVVLLAVNDVSGGVIVAVGVLGALGYAVAAVWFVVRTLIVAPALMLEGGGFWRSVGRAWRLTRGSFWRLLGVYLLVQILVGIVANVAVLPATFITSLVLDDPFGTSFASIVVMAVANVLTLTLTTVFSAAVIALLYIDVRMRREGLDVELARAAGQPTA